MACKLFLRLKIIFNQENNTKHGSEIGQENRFSDFCWGFSWLFGLVWFAFHLLKNLFFLFACKQNPLSFLLVVDKIHPVLLLLFLLNLPAFLMSLRFKIFYLKPLLVHFTFSSLYVQTGMCVCACPTGNEDTQTAPPFLLHKSKSFFASCMYNAVWAMNF